MDFKYSLLLDKFESQKGYYFVNHLEKTANYAGDDFKQALEMMKERGYVENIVSLKDDDDNKRQEVYTGDRATNQQSAHQFLCQENDGDSFLLVDVTMSRQVSSSGLKPIQDGDSQLLTVAIGSPVPSVGCTAWAECDTDLKEGETYTGYFDFDPRHSLKMCRMPKFTVVT